jgi:hypothetical protein
MESVVSKLHPVIFNDFQPDSVSVREPLSDEIVDWLETVAEFNYYVTPVNGKYSTDVMYNIITFEDEQMAMMFRLKWS